MATRESNFCRCPTPVLGFALSRLAVLLFRSVRLIRTALLIRTGFACSAVTIGLLPCCAQEIEFARDVLPILSDSCFQCHGPDAKVAEETGLRLDVEGDVFQDRGGYAAVTAGDLEKSELYQRLVTDDESLRMPPPELGRPLSDLQIATLRKWIEQGAEWGKHWAFEKVRRPDIGLSSEASPIDILVGQKLKAKGWTAMPQAEPRTLIRRLHLDVTGLPPSPAELDAFLKDLENASLTFDEGTKKRNWDAQFLWAWERAVDRVLASPTYGERMAWDWLEAARYADSNGYQGDRERTMWPWRDWVVRSFNENLPFDQFTQWQLAGDQLPNPTTDQILATGFNRNHMINGEGGRIAEENRVEYVMDMTETMGTVWLGLTLNCCRCHDHKFDPLLQKDYYRFSAFFNQTPVTGKGGDPQTAPVLEMPTTNQRSKRAELEASLRKLENQVAERKKQLVLDQSHWERDELKRIDADLARDQVERSLSQESQPKRAAQGDSDQSKADEIRAIELLADALRKTPDNRSKEEADRIVHNMLTSDRAYLELSKQVDTTSEKLKSLQAEIARVMVMEDRSERRETYVLDRGIYSQPGSKVDARFPEFISIVPNDLGTTESVGNNSVNNESAVNEDALSQPLRRIDLANWITSREHPLTSRVIVNRFWQMLFGIGLVKTAEDFGVQAEYPVQRELLDWLAAEFMESGWDVKHLLKCIVMSETYRRSSNVKEPSMYELDPENRYFARGPRFRMPAWMLRDQALAVSGLLSGEIAGPPVYPQQPAGIWKEATFGNKQYRVSEGAGQYRRTLYTFWRRIVGPTMLFDTAKRQVCEVKPLRTNTPMHALTTLNEFTYVQAAKALAMGILNDELGDLERLQRLSIRVLCRQQSDDEWRIWQKSIRKVRKFYDEHPNEARLLVAADNVDESDEASSEEMIQERAVWATIALNMLNLDETLTKE